MRIAMIGPFGLTPKQTMRSRALPLAKSLVQCGHEVCLFMPPWHTPDEADKTWTEDGVSLRYIPLRGGTVGITRRLVKEVLAWQPDVVHGFKPKAYSGLALWWLWQFHRRHIRLVLDTDDWEGWGGWNDREGYTAVQKHFFAWQERWGLEHCHALTVASRALQTIAWSRGIPPEQVIYLPNGPGISDQWSVVSGQSKRPCLLIYSRLFEFEVGRLVKILRRVQTAVPNVHILFVGAGLFAEDGAQLRQQLEEAGLMAAVTDAGWVEPDELPAVLSQGDVGLYLMADTLLNRAKCPVKLADMLALGIPVVGEDVGQVGEYVAPGQTGLLRPSGDTEGIIADLVYLLQNTAVRQQITVGAKEHIATHFNWKKLANHLEAVYEQG